MPAYSFEALDAQGATLKGVLEADTAKAARSQLRSQSLVPLQVSPVGAAGRVYITGRDGTTVVIKNGGAFEVLAKNVLDDGFDASPALVDNEMYMRGYRYLYSLGVK